MEKPRISVIGAGYVGLCTAVGFASQGYMVTLSDIDTKKISKINKVNLRSSSQISRKNCLKVSKKVA